MSKKLIAYLTVLLNLTILLSVSSINASTTPTVQPMYPVTWTNHNIHVQIPTNPAWAYTAILQSLEIWNTAQAWFVSSYYPTHNQTRFLLAASNSSQSEVTILYSQDMGQNWDGNTKCSQLNCQIWIVLSRFGQSNFPKSLLTIATHELGHIIGASDIPGTGTDLMQRYIVGRAYPSTLNLYAVYETAMSDNSFSWGDSVSLPPNIPYVTWNPNEQPLPEFSVVPALMMAVLLGSLLCFRKHREPKHYDQ